MPFIRRALSLLISIALAIHTKRIYLVNNIVHSEEIGITSRKYLIAAITLAENELILVIILPEFLYPDRVSNNKRIGQEITPAG